MENLYLDLMRRWGDALLELQVSGMGNPALDGGILCPACKHIHGRCPDAIYGFLTLADYTGESRYAEAARTLFRWQETLLCDDGTLYNDGGSSWNGITVFAVVNLYEALVHHGHLLTAEEKETWEDRMFSMSRWISETIVPGYENNINYLAGSAAVQALLGRYFHLPDYLEKARGLLDYVMVRFTPNGLLCGEGLPHDKVTERGCRPVDLGYNVEESVPMLVRCAIALEDAATLERLKEILRQQLVFLMPDGGWDNSFGTRVNKWTYWGSRTSDGCQTAYGLLADQDPLFAEAALRNTQLLDRCTVDGLLYGGPGYHSWGELPCVHHTFCHLNALAAAVDAELDGSSQRVELPMDKADQPVRYFPEIDTYRLALGKWRATVTGYDFGVDRGHATGGTMTLLWRDGVGPVLLSSVVDYKMAEPLNMQLSLQKTRHRPLTPRVEKLIHGVRYSGCYDTRAQIQVQESSGGIDVLVRGRMVTLDQQDLPDPAGYELQYHLREDSLEIAVELWGDWQGAQLVLPVIPEQAAVKGNPSPAEPEKIFFLSGGFSAREFILPPDGEGKLTARILL